MRLIDADALNYTMLYKENWMNGTGVEAPAVWKKDIESAPTIIEAERVVAKMRTTEADMRGREDG